MFHWVHRHSLQLHFLPVWILLCNGRNGEAGLYSYSLTKQKYFHHNTHKQLCVLSGLLAQHAETVCCKGQGHLEASVCAPVCPLFVMDVMTCWEVKLTRVKFPRLWSISTWLVVISIGDCLSCPQKEPEMSPQWDGVWSVEGNIRNSSLFHLNHSVSQTSVLTYHSQCSTIHFQQLKQTHKMRWIIQGSHDTKSTKCGFITVMGWNTALSEKYWRRDLTVVESQWVYSTWT